MCGGRKKWSRLPIPGQKLCAGRGKGKNHNRTGYERRIFCLWNPGSCKRRFHFPLYDLFRRPCHFKNRHRRIPSRGCLESQQQPVWYPPHDSGLCFGHGGLCAYCSSHRSISGCVSFPYSTQAAGLPGAPYGGSPFGNPLRSLWPFGSHSHRSHDFPAAGGFVHAYGRMFAFGHYRFGYHDSAHHHKRQ